MNYAAHNVELKHVSANEDPIIFMKPDSSLLKAGNPFFLPDFSSEIHYEAEIVVKINRLGKNIAEKFAHRYYDEVTLGIDFTARDLQNKLRENGMPWEISKAFDNAAALNALNYEVLKGDKEGISSIRVNKQYRIEFTVTDNGVEPLITVCNILELSNHYK